MYLRDYNEWTVSNATEFIEILNARQWILDAYKEEWDEYCKEEDEPDFWEFVDNTLTDEIEVMQILAKRYAKEEGVSSAVVDVKYNDNGEFYTIFVEQVIPESIDDFRDMMESYLAKNDLDDMTEVVMDKIERILGGEK